MKRLLSAMMLLVFASSPAAFSQQRSNNKYEIKGVAMDTQIDEPLAIAAIQLLDAKDSSLVKGVVSDMDGAFLIKDIYQGKYIIEISYVGYKDWTKNITLDASSPKVTDLQTISVKQDSKLLQGVEITAKLPKVEAVADTMMFNADAYRVPEGASIQELIKKLPGVEIDADGNIKVNGKSVSQLLINGKEFLSNDLETLLKNLPADLVDRVKTYEKQSDQARITGIDDGEEQTVIDLQIKQEMIGGFIGTFDLAYGNDYDENHLYQGRMVLNRFTDTNSFTVMGNANNVIDQGIGSGGRQYGNNYGQNTMQSIDGNYTYDGEKIEVNGNMGFSHNENDYRTSGSSESFLYGMKSFSNNRNKYINSSFNFNTNFMIEIEPDSLTNIIIRPNFNMGRGDNNSVSASATFNDDPFQYTDSPLDTAQWVAPYDTIRVNRNEGRSENNSQNMSGGASVQFNRRLGKPGRNITVRLQGDFNKSGNDGFSLNTTDYYQLARTLGHDTVNVRNRYTNSPSSRYNASAQIMYSEPIGKKMYLQFRYNINYNWNETDSRTYEFGQTDNKETFGILPENYVEYLDSSISKYSSYTTLRHNFEITYRINREKFNLNAGLRFQPTNTLLKYTQGQSYSLRKTMYNLYPTLRFSYEFNDNTELTLRYNGSTSQPSMVDLLDIEDRTNPLYITKGNKDLVPSFTSTLNADFNTYNTETQDAYYAYANFRRTRNSVSRKVTYDPTTGGTISQTENINGNWNVFGMFGANITFPDDRFTFSTYTNLYYNNQVGYQYLTETKQNIKSTTKSFSPSENLSFSFRNDILDITLLGNASWNQSKNDVNKSNLNTWNYAYGVSGSIQIPWDLTVYTDFLCNSRRGYSDAQYNTDEFIWNAQISKRFLRNKVAMISLQFFDILNQRKNYQRNVTATSRNETFYNAINQYFLVHFVYDLNIFNGKVIYGDEDMAERSEELLRQNDRRMHRRRW
ncbi:MAG: outer membrane beta-barrel protein [Bacteroidaceae bacterium]|nr:outer membrane beta-barrel protein [Bacteroidaceae bacterium]